MSCTVQTRRGWVSLVLLAALMISGCIPDTSQIATAPPSITVIAGPAGVSLNPYTNVLSSRQVGALMFRGLLSVDDAGMPIPDLTTEVPTLGNGGLSPSKTEVTYRLDPSATWADGEPLTADDVVFTWELIESGALIDDPRGAANVSEVAAIDDHTVRLTLREPDAPFVWRFVPYVLPRHLLEGSPDVLSDDFWFHPVGSRGRLVTRHLMGTQVDLVDPNEELPTIRIVFADTDPAARSVWESEYQCVWLSPPVGPTGSERSDTVPSSRWQAFVMNPSEGRSTADLAVRQAFSQATTVTVEPGGAGPYGFPISEIIEDSDDVESALTEAGWRERPDGRRFKDGEELVIDVIFNPISAEEGNRIEYDIPIKEYGGRIEPYPTFSYTDYPGASPLVLGDFDVALLRFPVGTPFGWAWPYEADDIPSELNPAGLNMSRITDRELEAAAKKMREAENPDGMRDELSKAWTRLEELYLVRWDVRLEQTVLFKGLDGVEAEPFEELALRSVNEWQILGTQNGE